MTTTAACPGCDDGVITEYSEVVGGLRMCVKCCGGARIRAAQHPPRHDEALLRIYLSAMPLGKYHKLDTDPQAVYRDGMPVIVVHGPRAANQGLTSALVHLLNTREQTEIPR